MSDWVKQNAGTCISAVALLFVASRLFAFSGHDFNTAVIVVRESGVIDVGLTALLQLLPGLVGVTLVYGALFMFRGKVDASKPLTLLLAGVVVGYCVYAVPWTLLLACVVLAVVGVPGSGSGEEDQTGSLGRVADFIRKAGLPVIGFAAASLIVGSSRLLPVEQVTTQDGAVHVGYVLSSESAGTLLLRHEDREAVRLPAITERRPCKLSDFTFSDAPPIMSLRQDRADYPLCDADRSKAPPEDSKD